MPRNPFSAVLRRVTKAGFQRKFVKDSVLPSWWDDEIASHPTGLEEGVGILSVRLGLVPSSLRDGDAAEFAADVEPKFKMRVNVEPSELEPIQHVATYALRLACAATPAGGAVSSHDPAEIRQRILDGGAPCVSLDGLLRWCWAAGVPVLHIGQQPIGKKKMDGLAARFGDRHAIGLCANHKSPARLLFILAHELGHVLLGHLPHDGVVIDDDGTTNQDQDEEEAEANGFAWTLLTGWSDYKFYTHPKWKASDLVRVATDCGSRDRVSAGVLAAQHGHQHPRYWPAAIRALSTLEPDADALQTVRDVAADSLDWSALPDEAADYLSRLIGLSTEAV